MNGKKQSSSLKQLSHSLSWALRHHALALNLTMTPDGFVPLDQILNSKHPKLKGWTEEQIRQVVTSNDKQRFTLQQKPAAAYQKDTETSSAEEAEKLIWCIRANQGHSIPGIDPCLLLTRLEPEEVAKLPVIVHGTYEEPWQNIQKCGYLSKMSRNHIHFAAGLPGSDGVISGMRKTCTIYIYLDTDRCAKGDLTFFRSDNGVLLTAGVGDEGKLPLDYISHVTDAEGKIHFDRRGRS